MAGQRKGWLEQRAETVRRGLTQFDGRGALTRLSPAELADLVGILASCNKNCVDILDEHERQTPSAFWFWLSVICGLGGILLMDRTFESVILTGGGILGAIKSLWDYEAHKLREQVYLALFWDVMNRKDALGSELTRRGIFYTH